MLFRSDLDFLNAELGLLGLNGFDEQCEGVFDTLKLARELHPGKRNSLDALCERYQVDNSHRTLHGALLDASLLAEVYLSMTRGQDSLAIELDTPVSAVTETGAGTGKRASLKVVAASAEEMAEHDRVLAGIDKASKGQCLWLKLTSDAA